MAESDSSEEGIFVGPVTLKEMKYNLTKKYYTPSTTTRHTFGGCPITTLLPTQENPGYEADHEMSVCNNHLNIAEENSSPNNSIIPLEDSLESNSYYKSLRKNLSTIVLSDTDEDDDVQLISEGKIKRENTSVENYCALASESKLVDSAVPSIDFRNECIEYQCKSAADTGKTNTQFPIYVLRVTTCSWQPFN